MILTHPIRRLAPILLLLAAHSLFAQTPTLHGDHAHPPRSRNWVETHLYFGLGPADDLTQGVTPAAWQNFLDQEVTPRFPAGLSVSELYGQWQTKPAPGKAPSTPARIRSKVIIIDYPSTPANARNIDAIRSAWKLRTGDQSVLKVTQPADVSF